MKRLLYIFFALFISLTAYAQVASLETLGDIASTPGMSPLSKAMAEAAILKAAPVEAAEQLAGTAAAIKDQSIPWLVKLNHKIRNSQIMENARRVDQMLNELENIAQITNFSQFMTSTYNMSNTLSGWFEAAGGVADFVSLTNESIGTYRAMIEYVKRLYNSGLLSVSEYAQITEYLARCIDRIIDMLQYFNRVILEPMTAAERYRLAQEILRANRGVDAAMREHFNEFLREKMTGKKIDALVDEWASNDLGTPKQVSLHPRDKAEGAGTETYTVTSVAEKIKNGWIKSLLNIARLLIGILSATFIVINYGRYRKGELQHKDALFKAMIGSVVSLFFLQVVSIIVSSL